jgi:hypothetical protein
MAVFAQVMAVAPFGSALSGVLDDHAPRQTRDAGRDRTMPLRRLLSRP